MRSSANGLFLWLGMAAFGIVSGLLYNLITEGRVDANGVAYGLFIGLAIGFYERAWILAPVRDRLRRLPTLAYLVTTALVLIVAIYLGTFLGGASSWAAGLTSRPLLAAVQPQKTATLFSLLAAALLAFGLRLRDLIGAQTFTDLLLSRYRRPVQEERAFLFLALAGSTTFAERYGDLKAQELLKSVFAAIADPVRRHGGRIDDYVGDLAIVSWPLALAAEGARCVAAVFAIRRDFERDAARWQERFGLVPQMRAALHGGRVVTAEIGVDKHKITFFGDIMNTTARLEALCRETGEAVLISSTLLERLGSLPEGILARSLGTHALRGREQGMEVIALRSRDWDPSVPFGPVEA